MQKVQTKIYWAIQNRHRTQQGHLQTKITTNYEKPSGISHIPIETVLSNQPQI